MILIKPINILLQVVSPEIEDGTLKYRVKRGVVSDEFVQDFNGETIDLKEVSPQKLENHLAAHAYIMIRNEVKAKGLSE